MAFVSVGSYLLISGANSKGLCPVGRMGPLFFSPLRKEGREEIKLTDVRIELWAAVKLEPGVAPGVNQEVSLGVRAEGSSQESAPMTQLGDKSKLRMLQSQENNSCLCRVSAQSGTLLQPFSLVC